MAELVIGLPRIEGAVERLGGELRELLSSYNSIALPLPRGLCRDLIYRGVGALDDDLIDISLKYFNTSLTRVWWSVIKEIPRLAVEMPHREVICYEEDIDPRSLEVNAYRLASLLIRARISLSGRIDPRPWIEFFKPVGKGFPRISGSDVIVADGYVRYKEILDLMEHRIARKLWRLIPTPLEILEMIAKGYLDESWAHDAVKFSVRYLGDYVIGSRDLTEAYERLLSDREYLDFLASIGLFDP
ncbi:MAG: hypothetical protein QXQ57_01095 [Sulfolobales archaeon]